MKTKVYVMAGIAFVIGLVLYFTGYALMGFNFKNLPGLGKTSAKHFVASPQTHTLVIRDSNVHIELTSTSDNTLSIDYFENKYNTYSISENDGTLSLHKKTNRRWYHNFMYMPAPDDRMVIHVPENSAMDLKIKTSNNHITGGHVAFNTLTLDTSNGHINLNGADGNAVNASTSNGKITVKDMQVSSEATFHTSNGTIGLEHVSAGADVFCTTSGGKILLEDITGNNISAKTSNGAAALNQIEVTGRVYVKSSNGRIQFENIAFGQELECITSNNSISGIVSGSMGDYSIYSKTSNGSSNLPENMAGGQKMLTFKTSNGNISVDFEE